MFRLRRGDVLQMTSGMAGLVVQFLGGKAEGIDALVTELTEEQDPRDSRQAHRHASGQPPHLFPQDSNLRSHPMCPKGRCGVTGYGGAAHSRHSVRQAA